MTQLRGLKQRAELAQYVGGQAQAADLMYELQAAVRGGSSADLHRFIGDKLAMRAVLRKDVKAPLVRLEAQKKDLGRIWLPAVLLGTVQTVDAANGGTITLEDGFAVNDVPRAGYRLGPVFNSTEGALGRGTKVLPLDAFVMTGIFQQSHPGAELETALLLESSGAFIESQPVATP